MLLICFRGYYGQVTYPKDYLHIPVTYPDMSTNILKNGTLCVDSLINYYLLFHYSLNKFVNNHVDCYVVVK